MKKEVVKADVLCLGGGPAGLMAAIRAAELGTRVVVADKGNTLYSGSGSSGNDHFLCYIPEVHGPDVEAVVRDQMQSPMGGGAKRKFWEIWAARSFEMIKLWDSWGIPMKYKGQWEFAGHAFPGRPRMWLKYAGGNQKQVLTEQVMKRGARIMNRVTAFDLLTDKDRVVGALGFDTWRDMVIEFQAKAVFLGTGGCTRLYPASTPGWLFNLPMCPYATGDGRAMVYRAGGELFDMEFIGQWAGLKYFSRAGKATWIGVLRRPDDKPIGPFITKPDKIYGDITMDCWTTVFDDYMKSGKGPVYMDCRGASKEDIEYMKFWLLNEGNKGILDHMAEEGIDPIKHAMEFRTYEIGLKGGVRFNLAGETSLKGLYAAGDEYFGGMSNAVIWGWIAGESAAKYAKGADFSNPDSAKAKTDEGAARVEAILNRDEGATWKEANIALQQIMGEYAGVVRSETLLAQGLRNMGRLKDKARSTLVARNGHEVGRCLEVLNLIDLGEVVMQAAQERKETRLQHNRVDFPFTNPLLDKTLVMKQKDGKAAAEWRDK